MIKTLRKVGNSSALLLDKPVMELLGLEQGAQVRLTVDGGSLIVTPADPRAVDPRTFQRALNRVAREDGDVLRKLAE
jgi:antitoxin component of MazEF toxin-antitoxin module